MLLIILGWAPVCFTMNNFDKDERATQVNSATPSDDSSSKFNQESPTTQTDQRTELKNTSQSNKRRLLPMPNPKTPPSPISATTEQTETFPSKAEPVEASSFRPISTSKTNQTDVSSFRHHEDVASPIQMFSPIHQPQTQPEQLAKLKHAEERKRHKIEKQFEQERSSQEKRFNQTGQNIETNRKLSEAYQEELRQDVINAIRIDIKTGKTVEKDSSQKNLDHDNEDHRKGDIFNARTALIKKFKNVTFNFRTTMDIQAWIKNIPLQDKELIKPIKRCDTEQKEKVLNSLIIYLQMHKISRQESTNIHVFNAFKNILNKLAQKFQTLFMNDDQKLTLEELSLSGSDEDNGSNTVDFGSLEYKIIIQPLPQQLVSPTPSTQSIANPKKLQALKNISPLDLSLILQPDADFSNPNDLNLMKQFFSINNEPTNDFNGVKAFLNRHNISITNLNWIQLFLYLNDIPTSNFNAIYQFLSGHQIVIENFKLIQLFLYLNRIETKDLDFIIKFLNDNKLPATEDNLIKCLLSFSIIPTELRDQINQFLSTLQPQTLITAPPAAKRIADPLIPQILHQTNRLPQPRPTTPIAK